MITSQDARKRCKFGGEWGRGGGWGVKTESKRNNRHHTLNMILPSCFLLLPNFNTISSSFQNYNLKNHVFRNFYCKIPNLSLKHYEVHSFRHPCRLHLCLCSYLRSCQVRVPLVSILIVIRRSTTCCVCWRAYLRIFAHSQKSLTFCVILRVDN